MIQSGCISDYNIVEFSECGIYRYTLWRWWDRSKPFVLFIGLNPSTADEINDDPTVRRCIRFAESWGFGGLCMMNLFAFRATDPKIMKAYLLPIGTDNDDWLMDVSRRARKTIAVWGIHGGHLHRDRRVIELFPYMYCLGVTKYGYPKHPLYLKKDTMLMKFEKSSSGGTNDC